MINILTVTAISLLSVSAGSLSLDDFEHAVKSNNKEIVREYVKCCFNNYDYIGTQQIGRFAIDNTDLETFKVLFEELMKTDMAGNETQTFHLAVYLYRGRMNEKGAHVLEYIKDVNKYENEPFLVEAIRNSEPELAQELISRGADVNIKSQNGRLPLDLAVGFGLIELARIIFPLTNLTEEQREYYSNLIE